MRTGHRRRSGNVMPQATSPRSEVAGPAHGSASSSRPRTRRSATRVQSARAASSTRSCRRRGSRRRATSARREHHWRPSMGTGPYLLDRRRRYGPERSSTEKQSRLVGSRPARQRRPVQLRPRAHTSISAMPPQPWRRFKAGEYTLPDREQLGKRAGQHPTTSRPCSRAQVKVDRRTARRLDRLRRRPSSSTCDASPAVPGSARARGASRLLFNFEWSNETLFYDTLFERTDVLLGQFGP